MVSRVTTSGCEAGSLRRRLLFSQWRRQRRRYLRRHDARTVCVRTAALSEAHDAMFETTAGANAIFAGGRKRHRQRRQCGYLHRSCHADLVNGPGLRNRAVMAQRSPSARQRLYGGLDSNDNPGPGGLIFLRYRRPSLRTIHGYPRRRHRTHRLHASRERSKHSGVVVSGLPGPPNESAETVVQPVGRQDRDLRHSRR